MKKYKIKFILMSISFLTIFMTAFATTFAWVGIFTYANTEKFNINLKVVDTKANYFLTISSTGEPGTFSDTVSLDDIRKQILINMGKNVSRLTTPDAINFAYINATGELNPVTTAVDSNNAFTQFKRLSCDEGIVYDQTIEKYYPGLINTNVDYMTFDLYLSVDTKEGISENTEINAPVFMTDLEETIIGTNGEHRILDNNFRKIDYTDNPYSNLLPYLPFLQNQISDHGTIKVNSGNSVRIGYEIYEPIDINNSYNVDDKIVSNRIFYNGDYYPSMDENQVYNLGGILPTEFNMAAQEYMNMKSYIKMTVPETALSRKEDQLIDKNSQLWTKADNLDNISNYLGVHNGVQTKMKIKVFLWFEGWDSDCLLGIKSQNVTFNLAFTADHEEII